MKRSAYISIPAVIMMIAGCSRIGADDSRPVIMMSANVGELSVETKAAVDNAYTGTVPSQDKPLAADLWFSLTSGQYDPVAATDQKTYIPCHAEVKFVTGDPVAVLYNGEQDKALKYPTDGTVHCMGFYPQGAWSYVGSDGVIATADIDGSKDLMFAPEISGTWTNKFSTQTYEHVLTWLKVVACATSYDAIDAWGRITEITVSSKTEAYIKENGAVGYDDGSDGVVVVFDDEDGKSLDIVFDETDTGVHGSVFVSPAEKVTVKVSTKDGKTAQNDISVTEGFKAGCQYVLALYFDSLAIIDGFCTLTSWENENDNLYTK